MSLASLLPALAIVFNGDPIISALVTILIIVVICAIVWWILSLIPMAEPFRRIVQIIVGTIAGLAAIVILLRLI